MQLKAALRGQDYATQVQMLAPDAGASGGPGPSVKESASHGMAGSGGALPHADRIQKSFGGYDISNVQAYTDAHAREGSAMMGASAYATGNSVVLGQGGTDLHTVAHEAAHVVQQRAGVSLSGGVGKAGDPYERHADAVADLVVQGKSAEGLLGEMAGGGGNGVQMKPAKGSLEMGTPSMVGLPDEKLGDTMADNRDGVSLMMAERYSFGAESIKKPTPQGDSRLDEANPLVANTRKRAGDDGAADLGILASELDLVGPLLEAWLRSESDVQTAAAAGGINVETPGEYESMFSALGDEVHRGGEASATSRVMAGAGPTPMAKVQSSSASMRAALVQLMIARTELQSMHDGLEIERVELAKSKKEAEIASIDAAITATLAMIGKVVSVAATVTGGLGNALGGVGWNVDLSKDPADTVKSPSNNLDAGAKKVGSAVSGNVGGLHGAIREIFHGDEIRTLTLHIAALDGQLEKLNSNVKLAKIQTIGLALEKDTEMLDAQAKAVAGAQSHLTVSFGLIGREFDQKGRGENERMMMPQARDGSPHSMEVLLSVVAALTNRGENRQTFGATVGRCNHLANPAVAAKIFRDALESGRGRAGVRDGEPLVTTRTPIDHIEPGQGFNPDLRTIAQAASLRSTFDTVQAAILRFDASNASETRIEEAWRSMATRRTNGRLA